MKLKVQPLFRREPQFPSDHEWRAIYQRDDPAIDATEAHFSNSDAVMSALATSDIFLPWSIAVRRSSA